jgi:phage shock protein C
MKTLVRSNENRQIAGVIGGLGEYLNVDPTILRLVAVFLGFITGIVPGVITYIIGWIIIPEGPAVTKKK